MELSELWFLLIAVLWIGYLFFEGFDFGVGMGVKFLAKDEFERRVLINTIGPHWDANEVWLLTAGGAMFAAFPHWYATLFSGYYLPFVLLLLALIVRGVSFEYRGKHDTKKWKSSWDWSIFIGSIIPPFLVGVLFAGLIKGLPIDENMNMHASFFGDIVNVYTLIGGIVFVLLSYLHGLMFTTLKTNGDLRKRAQAQTLKLYWITLIGILLFIALTAVYTDAFTERGTFIIPIYAIAVILYLALYSLVKNGKEGLSFTFTGLILILVTASFFVILFPDVMISSIDPAYSISVYDAASGPYSLKVMTIVAVILVPIVLAYTIWSYYIFRKRITRKEHLEY